MKSSRRMLRPPNNVVDYLNKTAIYGDTCRFKRQVFGVTLKCLDIPKELHVNSLYASVKNLEEILIQSRPDKSEAVKLFSKLRHECREAGRRQENEKEKGEFIKWLREIIFRHATEVLQNFIVSSTLLPLQAAVAYERNDLLMLKGIAMEVFHALCVEFENLAVPYAEQTSFLQCLFCYMQYRETSIPACRVIECLLLSRKNVLDLSTIENLQEIVLYFDDIALGNFCKILAILLSELDMYEHKTSLYAQTKQKKNKNFYIRDVNQDIILRIPSILPRLVNIACAKPYTPCSPSSHQESAQWMQWIDNQFSRELRYVSDDDDDDEDNDEAAANAGLSTGLVGAEADEDSDATPSAEPSIDFIGGITHWSRSNRLTVRTSVKIATELTFRADAVCVLGLLLVGRHRKEVQKELAQLQLIPQLSDLFDNFIWRAHIRRDNNRLPGHNSSCECSPEVALKIQVLRLIHSFCDHSDYKHVMLSWNEYSELQAVDESSTSLPVPSWLTRKSMCVGVKGLLSKIVEVMKWESKASTFRFWLSRAIESYLRGSFSSADQDFLLRRNLLQHVTENLVTSNIRHKEVLQSSFDLLGELIKFNMSAFQELNKHMYARSRQDKLISLMDASLVDSNMFIRSLILSFEFFVSTDDRDLTAFSKNHCHLLANISSVKSRVHYLRKLLSLINIHNLTQENVSCLNTALVILMFGLKKRELPQYLQSLTSNQAQCSVATNECAGLLDNLRDLLLFWQDHYLQKDKDCTILERSSRINFQEWRDAVSILTKEEPENPCAIVHYTMQGVSSRAS